MLIYINDVKIFIFGLFLLKMYKVGNEVYRIYVRRKCFFNRKEVCLLKDNFKKIRLVVVIL